MKKLNKIVGELAIVSPLIILSIPFDLWSEGILIVMLLLIYKTRYATNYHAEKNAICIAISYTAVTIGLIISFLMPKQYLFLILIYNIVAYVSAKIGAMQEKAKKYELIEKPYLELVEFYHEYKNKPKPKIYTFDELLSFGLTDRQADLYIAKKKGFKGERLIDYMLDKGYDFSKSTCDREIKIIKDIMKDC